LWVVGATVYTYLMYIWAYFTWVVCCDICSGTYIGVPSLEVEDQTFISAQILLWGWAEIKFFVGTQIAECVDRVVTYKESTYVCH